MGGDFGAWHIGGLRTGLRIAGDEIIGGEDLLSGQCTPPMDRAVVISLRNDHMVVVDLQYNDTVGVVVDTEDIAHAHVREGELRQHSGRKVPKGGVTEQEGKGHAAISARVDAGVPGIVVVVGPGRPLRILLLHCKDGLIGLLLVRFRCGGLGWYGGSEAQNQG